MVDIFDEMSVNNHRIPIASKNMVWYNQISYSVDPWWIHRLTKIIFFILGG